MLLKDLALDDDEAYAHRLDEIAKLTDCLVKC